MGCLMLGSSRCAALHSTHYSQTCCLFGLSPYSCVLCAAAGALLLNLGSLMSRWTNGLWKATLHRVTNPLPAKARSSRRLSMAFFHKPNYDAIIEVGC